MDVRRRTGQIGEKAAADHLQEQGLQIINQNWSTRLGELDIIACYANYLIFVEVRTTRSQRYGYGFQSVNYRKQQKVRRLAMQYIQQHSMWSRSIRFDVVSVLLDQQDRIQKIDHIPNAF